MASNLPDNVTERMINEIGNDSDCFDTGWCKKCGGSGLKQKVGKDGKLMRDRFDRIELIECPECNGTGKEKE